MYNTKYLEGVGTEEIVKGLFFPTKRRYILDLTRALIRLKRSRRSAGYAWPGVLGMVADARHCARGRLYELKEPRRVYNWCACNYYIFRVETNPFSFSDGTELTLTQEETQYFMPAIPNHPKYLVETAVTFWRFPVIQPCTIAVP